MTSDPEFIDYYALLQVDPDCTDRTLEVAYHYYAKLYHPDNPETADVDKFTATIEAYKALRDPEERARYDRQYDAAYGPLRRRAGHSGSGIDQATAAQDAEIHYKILLSLYKKRRERASNAGIAGWLVQESLGCSDEEFEFHVWYLRAKGFVDITEQGTLAITIAGVDHVIASSQAAERDRKRIELLVRPETPD
jgi:curved DNA-binding protein